MKNLLFTLIFISMSLAALPEKTLLPIDSKYFSLAKPVSPAEVRCSLCPAVFEYPTQERFRKAFVCARPVLSGLSLVVLNNFLKGEPLDTITNFSVLLVCLPTACVIIKSLYNVTNDIRQGN